MDDKELQYKTVLIRDGIVSASYQMPKAEVFIYIFIDYLYLFFQRPLVFAFWQKKASDDTPRFIYSTLKDPTYASYIYYSQGKEDPEEAYPLYNTDYLISAYVFDAETVEESRKNKDKGQKHPLFADPKTMRDIRHILCYHPDMFNEHVFQLLSDSLAHHSSENRVLHKKQTVVPIPMDYKTEVRPLLEGMRDVFDGAISDASNSPHLHQDDRGEDKILNVMFFVKTLIKEKLRCGFYNYTTARVLTNKQISQFGTWMDKGCPEAQLRHDCPIMKTGCTTKERRDTCISLLQTPFCDGTRAVIDLVFSSGTVDFGLNPFGGRLEDYTTSREDEGFDDEQSQKKILDCMYAKNKGAFYIPIHVNGVPWLVLHSIIGKTDTFKIWRFNYNLCRDVSLRISIIIREESKKLYLKLLAAELAKGMKIWFYHSAQKQKIIAEINIGWQKLAQVYPYPLTKLSRKERENSDSIRIQKGEYLWLSIDPNPFHQTHIDWHLCEKEEIIRRCKNAVDKVLNSKQHWDLHASARTTHLIRTPLNTSKTMVERLDISTHEKSKITNKLDQCLQLHYFSTCMLDSKKHAEYLKNNRSTVNSETFFDLLRSEGENRIKELVEYSMDSSAPITRAATDGTIEFIHHPLKEQQRVQYYNDQLAALWDELLSNIDQHGSRYKSNIRVFTEVKVSKMQKRILIYLNVCNETKHNHEPLQKIINDLNEELRSSGTSMISLSCETLWQEPAYWAIDTNSDTSFHISIPVGEIKC
ncbi:MAG: hypothetical protein Q9M22_05615 [Mariprofundaceae bacterium]|nr:hypothetical protein [Mariprofundaceae bacterium]